MAPASIVAPYCLTHLDCRRRLRVSHNLIETGAETPSRTQSPLRRVRPTVPEEGPELDTSVWGRRFNELVVDV